MAYLDGKIVDDKEITPAKHKLIGSFRFPTPPRSDGSWGVMLCSCGQLLWTIPEVDIHWKKGCMDVMQYETIGREK